MLISIEGIAQSGKSSVIEALTRRFGSSAHKGIVHVEFAIEWNEHNADLLTYTLLRAAAVVAQRARIGHLLSDRHIVIVESYDLWFRAMFGVCGSPKLYEGYKDCIRAPDLTVFIDCDVAIAYERVGRCFNTFVERLLLPVYHSHARLCVNSTDLDATSVAERVLGIINERGRSPPGGQK